MGDFKFTTREKNQLNIEKSLFTDKKAEPAFGFPGQTNPACSSVKKEKHAGDKKIQKTQLKVRENSTNPITVKEESEADQIVNAVIMAKKSIVEEISANFEKKLEKLDDAIIELISCKTENERLKAKIDNLTRENYKLKKETRSFRQIMPGFFIKVKTEEINL